MVADALVPLLLAGLLAARFRWWLKDSPPLSVADIRVFSRGLSRMVYLVLYLIIGAEQIVNIVGGFKGAGGAAQDLEMLKPTGQAFLLDGLIALAMIRVLAYLTWRRYRSSLAPYRTAHSSDRPVAATLVRPY